MVAQVGSAQGDALSIAGRTVAIRIPKDDDPVACSHEEIAVRRNRKMARSRQTRGKTRDAKSGRSPDIRRGTATRGMHFAFRWCLIKRSLRMLDAAKLAWRCASDGERDRHECATP